MADNPFGRGSAAGNLIFNLYNKPNKKSTYDPLVAQLMREARLKQEAEEQANRVTVVPKSKCHINTPKPMPYGSRRRGDLDDVPFAGPVRHVGKKPLQQIQHEIDTSEAVPIPEPKKPLISEKDKEKFQLLMQFNGKMPEKPEEKPRPAPPPPVPRLNHQQLFESILMEIDERKLFLQEMRRVGMGKKYDVKVKKEISDRILELKLLDKELANQAEAKLDVEI